MGRIVLCTVLILVILHAAPFLVYGTLSVITGLQPPDQGSPLAFMLSVLISKLGHAIAFVLIYYLARNSLSSQWLLYALVWWLMFTLGEVGQAILPSYTWEMAAGGIISEAIYFPLSALVINRLIGVDEHSFKPSIS